MSVSFPDLCCDLGMRLHHTRLSSHLSFLTELFPLPRHLKVYPLVVYSREEEGEVGPVCVCVCVCQLWEGEEIQLINHIMVCIWDLLPVVGYNHPCDGIKAWAVGEQLHRFTVLVASRFLVAVCVCVCVWGGGGGGGWVELHLEGAKIICDFDCSGQNVWLNV